MNNYYTYGKGRLNGVYGGRGSNFGGCMACGGLGLSWDDVMNALLPANATAAAALGRPLTMDDVQAAIGDLNAVTYANPATAAAEAALTVLDKTLAVGTSAAAALKAQAIAEVEAKAKGGASEATIGVLVVAAAAVGLGYVLFFSKPKRKR